MNRMQLIAPTFAALPDSERLRIYDATAIGRHLYFIKGKNKVKIGIAENPLRRMNSLQVGSPVKLTLICVLPYGALLEKDVHLMFKECYSHGEWFNLEPPIQDFINKINKLAKEIGIKWDSKTNQVVDLGQNTVSLSLQARKNLLAISGKTPHSNTTS